MSLSTIFLEHPLNPLELNLDLDERLRLYRLKNQVPNMATQSNYQPVYEESINTQDTQKTESNQHLEYLIYLCLKHLNKIIYLSLMLFVFCFTTSAYLIYLEPELYNAPKHLQELADLKSKSSTTATHDTTTAHHNSLSALSPAPAVPKSATAKHEKSAAALESQAALESAPAVPEKSLAMLKDQAALENSSAVIKGNADAPKLSSLD